MATRLRIYNGESEVYYTAFVTFSHSVLPIFERFRSNVGTRKHDARGERYIFFFFLDLIPVDRQVIRHVTAN